MDGSEERGMDLRVSFDSGNVSHALETTTLPSVLACLSASADNFVILNTTKISYIYFYVLNFNYFLFTCLFATKINVVS